MLIQPSEVTEFQFYLNKVLFRPKEKKLAELYRYVGINYDERVMSSIVNEVVKSVVAQVTKVLFTVQCVAVDESEGPDQQQDQEAVGGESQHVLYCYR